MKKMFLFPATIFAALSFLLFGLGLVGLIRESGAQDRYEELSEAVSLQSVTENSNGAIKTGYFAAKGNSGLDWEALLAINDETVGWLSINNTNIDIPVVQPGEESADFYLTHNFWRQYASSGTPYLDERCDVDGHVLMIYGHRTVATSYFFNEITNAYTSEVFESLGSARWTGRNGSSSDFLLLCAASIDATDSRWLALNFESTVELRSWLAWAVGEADQVSGYANNLISCASRVLICATCTGRTINTPSRSLLLFVECDAKS